MCRWDIHRKHAWRREKMFISFLKTAKTSNMSIITLRQKNHLSVSLSYDVVSHLLLVLSALRSYIIWNVSDLRIWLMNLTTILSVKTFIPFAFQMFSEYIKKALKHYIENGYSRWKGTLQFFESIVEWWNILKVKSIFKGIEKRNSAWEPITKQKLTKIVAWMVEVGKMRAKNGKIQGILPNIICNSSVRQLSIPRRRTRLRFTTNCSLGLFTEKIFARYR